VTATLPAALLVVFWWRRGRLDRRRDVLPLAPFFAAAVAAGLTTAWVERAFIGARGAEFEFSIVERFLIAGRAIWFYATTLAWPVNLQFIYPRWNVSQAVWWQYLFPIAAAGMLALAWRFRTRSRTPLAALLLFAGTLSPALGFVNVYPFRFSFVADHFQYLASIPMLAGIAAGLTAMGRRLIATRRAAAAAGVVAIAAVLGTLTWRHSRQYADAETLYRGTIARNPAAWMAYNNLAMLKLGGLPSQPAEAAALLQESLRVYADNPEAHNNLGVAFQRLGRLADAEAEHREALRLFPNYAGAYNNLGIVAEQQGRFAEAVRYYTTALELQTRAGSQAETHHNLGSVLQKLGRFDEAIAQIETALRINPQYADARDNLGTALTRVGRIDDAIAQYREAIRLRPGFAEAHNNLGTALARAGRLDEAVVEFKETIRIKPDAAVTFVNLADAERRQQRPDDAIASLQTAIGLQPALAFAHYSLGNLLHDKGQVDAAIRAYLKALEHEPEATAYAIYNDLGVALAQSGRRQEAIAAFDRALKIKPDFEDARANRARIR
jgi:tetratricopeptide (TPR) repeat protein